MPPTGKVSYTVSDVSIYQSIYVIITLSIHKGKRGSGRGSNLAPTSKGWVLMTEHGHNLEAEEEGKKQEAYGVKDEGVCGSGDEGSSYMCCKSDVELHSAQMHASQT